MKSRKRNRMKGFDYASNNLYFVTNCVKDNFCCLGRVIPVGTGRDLSVHDAQNHYSQNHIPVNQESSSEYIVQLNQFGLIVEERIHWLMNQYSYIDIHNYVIMPNHIHFILEIDRSKVNAVDVKIKSLSSIMGALKTTSSRQIREAGFSDFSWHRSFHDHIIRNEVEYDRISNYINLNPQKWCQDRFFQND